MELKCPVGLAMVAGGVEVKVRLEVRDGRQDQGVSLTRTEHRRLLGLYCPLDGGQDGGYVGLA